MKHEADLKHRIEAPTQPPEESVPSLERHREELNRLTDEVVAVANTYQRTEEGRMAQRTELARLSELVRNVRETILKEIDAQYILATEASSLEGETSWPVPHGVRRDIRMKEEGGVPTPVLYGKKGRGASSLTVGDMAVAPLWDHDYHLAPEVPLPYKLTYLNACAAHAQSETSDRAWMLEEVCASYNENSPTREALLHMLQREKDPSGIIAERMVKSLFTKLCTDADLEIDIQHVSARDDVEDKIDFILHMKGHVRGAGTTLTRESGRDIGVQFTLDERATDRKMKQIEYVKRREKVLGNRRVDSHVLVTLPLRDVETLHAEWQKSDHRIPGGPETLWSPEIQEQVFRGVLQKLPAGLIDIDAEWDKARHA
ncbi:MAG: hypothetical protein KBD21_02025 [Candidatus Pacebacteria bacterium]|nr:hypothetical protein [Candidatus Paceibacterota bacterium]